MIKKLSVIGAGQMGSGIAQVAAQIAKIPKVILYDKSRPQLDSQSFKIKESLEKSKQKGLLSSADEIKLTMAAIKTTTNIDDVEGSDFVIEVDFWDIFAILLINF